jgi:inner membrane protein
MMGLSHAIVGALAYLSVHQVTKSGLTAPSLNYLAMAVLGSLAPDLDSPKSSLGRRVRSLSRGLKSFSGHRGFTHSLLACFVLGLGLALICSTRPGWEAYGVAFIIGYTSHILADWLTREGVPLLWPFPKRFHCPLNFATGGLLEYAFSLAAGSFLVLWLFQLIH